MTTTETEPKPPSRSKRTYLLVGVALVLLAGIAILWRLAPRHPGPPRLAGSAAGAPGATPVLESIGPLRAGDTVGEGWRVDRIEHTSTEVQVALSRADKKWTLGLASPEGQKDAPLVPFPDVYVWYSGEAGPGPDPDLQALIQALVARLREGAEGKPLHARLMEWASGPR